ncbi:hypothetical protein BDAP_001039 [Binucleata daphniae]
MLSKENLNALKLEIKNLLIKKSQCYKKVNYEEILRSANSDCIFFTQFKHEPLGEDIRAYEIKLKADTIYVQNSYMIINIDGVMKIYKYNDKYKFTKVREIKSHLLLFFLNTKKYDLKTHHTFYNMLITFIEQKISRIEKLLEDVLFYLDINNLVKCKIENDTLICSYNDARCITYDYKLSKIDEKYSYEAEDISIDKSNFVFKVDNSHEIITVKQDYVSIDYKNKSFVSVIEFKNIRQASFSGKDLFMICNEKINVLAFRNRK